MVMAMAATMAMLTNLQSREEGRPVSEAADDATADESPEERWLAERISCVKGLISGWGSRGITLYYARLGWGPVHSVGGKGGCKKGSCCK